MLPERISGHEAEPVAADLFQHRMRDRQVELQVIGIEIDVIIGAAAIDDETLADGGLLRVLRVDPMSSVAGNRRQNDGIPRILRPVADIDGNAIGKARDGDAPTIAECMVEDGFITPPVGATL